MSWRFLFVVDVIGCTLSKCFSLREYRPIIASKYEEFSEVALIKVNKMQRAEQCNVM